MTPAAIWLTAFSPLDWLVEGFGYQASDTLVEGVVCLMVCVISAFGFVSSAEPVCSMLRIVLACTIQAIPGRVTHTCIASSHWGTCDVMIVM